MTKNLTLSQFSIEANPSESCLGSCLKDRNDPFPGTFSYLEVQLELKPEFEITINGYRIVIMVMVVMVMVMTVKMLKIVLKL